MDNVRAEQGKMLLRYEKMYDIVFDILSNDVRARNDDKWLILQVLERTGQQIVIGKESVVWHIPLEELGSIPSFENIRRRRQDIQNRDGMLLPTDPRVLCDRKIKEDAIKTYYSDKPEIIQHWIELAYGVK